MKSTFLNKRIWIYILIFISINFFYGTTLETHDDIYERINRNLEIFGKTYKEIALNYVDNLDIDKFMRAGIEGMLSTLDPYTVYYDEKSKAEIDLITAGKYGGVGITIELHDSILVITDIMSGYEAERKGLRQGDIILEIDGTNIKNYKLDKIRTMVRGEPGTQVKFKIERNKETFEVTLTRQEIILKNIPFYGFIGNPSDGIGYIKLSRFTATSVNEMENTIKNLKVNSNLKGLIIDLRNNGGGLLDAAIGILNKLVPKNNLLLITKGNQIDASGIKKEREEKFFSKEEPILPPDIPLVILINGSTASASEIVAGAIQDLDRGVIVGTTSLGKGLVQQIKDIGYNSKLKITTQRYFTPSGRWIQQKNYFLENKYGVFIDNFIQENQTFKTINGRTVYANGGITPDIEVKMEPNSEVYNFLLKKDAFFKFANYYLQKYPDIKTFECTDIAFKEFEEFLIYNGIFYSSFEELKLKEVKDSAEKKNYPDSFLNKIETLIELSKKESEKEFLLAKEELKIIIENEINKRLLSEEERIAKSFDKDKQIQEAINLLQNLSIYNSILNKLN
ncbi:MAG: S41 family peptidase [Ignavibacteria bacterium]|nr:S41 family peptidase [Ignavibacteria bacterium]